MDVPPWDPAPALPPKSGAAPAATRPLPPADGGLHETSPGLLAAAGCSTIAAWGCSQQCTSSTSSGRKEGSPHCPQPQRPSCAAPQCPAPARPAASKQDGARAGAWGLTRNCAGTSPPNPCPSPRAPPRALSFQGNSSGVIAKSSGASSAGCNVINLPARSWQESNHGCYSKTEPGDN